MTRDPQIQREEKQGKQESREDRNRGTENGYNIVTHERKRQRKHPDRERKKGLQMLLK